MNVTTITPPPKPEPSVVQIELSQVEADSLAYLLQQCAWRWHALLSGLNPAAQLRMAESDAVCGNLLVALQFRVRP